MATKPKQQAASKQAAAPTPEPEKKQVPATTGGKIDTKGMILVGDQQDVSHIKNTARGNENVGVDDLVIPRLEIVQGLSPALKPGDPGYIEGAKQGDLINSVTNRVYGREVFVVPVHYSKQWLVWKLFEQGGGFFGAFNNPQDAEKRKEEVVAGGEKADFIEVLDTPTHLCLLVNMAENTIDEVMIPMSKTKAKVSRAWNTMVRLTGQDRFARAYRISTALEKNKKNQEYWNYVVSQSGTPNPLLYGKAEKLFEQVSTGARNVVMDVKNMGADGATADESNAEM